MSDYIRACEYAPRFAFYFAAPASSSESDQNSFIIILIGVSYQMFYID